METDNPAEGYLDDEAYEEARIVADDLRHLREAWSPDISEAQIRRESPILRRLLIDEAYGRSWRAIGLPKEPIVTASDLKAWLGTLELGFIGMAVAELPFQPFPNGVQARTEAKYKTTREAPSGSLLMIEASVRGRFMSGFATPEEVGDDPDAIRDRYLSRVGAATDAHFWLSDYLASPALLIEGTWFTRREIVKYISNRRGGAHYGLPVPRIERAKFALLDKTHARIGDLEIAHLQMLAVSHSVCMGPDAFRFQEQFRSFPVPADPFA